MRSDNHPPEKELVVLARVTGLFGVRGWVKVFSYTEPREGILNYRDCFLLTDGETGKTRIEEGQKHGKGVIVRLAGIEDRDAAAELLGSELAVARSSLPEPDPDSFYWADLEGLEVQTGSGRRLGTVDHLIETGANDVLVVRSGDRETLIPFVVGPIVKDVDIEAGVINVDWDWE